MEAYLPISICEKFAFCQRQAYLSHTEREDAENRFLVEGSLLHRRVNEGRDEDRADGTICRGLHLVCHELRVTGIADVVAFGGPHPFPIEYKRGKGKRRASQLLQLTLQVLCLEEMLGVPIAEAAIYHGGTRRRERVAIDETLRAGARTLVAEAHRVLAGERPPPAVLFSGCAKCSLNAICLPGIGSAAARAYLARHLERE